MISNLRKHMIDSWALLSSLVLQVKCVHLMKKAEKFPSKQFLWKHWDFGQNIYVESICFHNKMKIEIPENWSLLLQSHCVELQSSHSLGASHLQPLGELYSWWICISPKVAQLCHDVQVYNSFKDKLSFTIRSQQWREVYFSALSPQVQLGSQVLGILTTWEVQSNSTAY